MKAAFGLGRGKFEIRDAPAPEPAADEALVRVKACGICGSDKHEFAAQGVRDRISGHEFSGVIERIEPGDFVSDLAVGDAVVADPIGFCGECRYCRVGRTSLCANRSGVLGYGKSGAFAEYSCVPLRSLCRKPEGLSFAEASITEPLGVALHGASQRDATGLDCIVFGAGAIGTMLARVLELRAAGQVFLVDMDESHLEAARHVGDFTTIHAADERAWDALDGAEIKIAFDVVGNCAPVLAKAVEILPSFGSLVSIGARKPGAVSMDDVLRKELSLIRSTGVDTTEMHESLELLAAGRVDVGPLITGCFPLDRMTDAFAAARAGMKVVVEP